MHMVSTFWRTACLQCKLKLLQFHSFSRGQMVVVMCSSSPINGKKKTSIKCNTCGFHNIQLSFAKVYGGTGNAVGVNSEPSCCNKFSWETAFACFLLSTCSRDIFPHYLTNIRMSWNHVLFKYVWLQKFNVCYIPFKMRAPADNSSVCTGQRSELKEKDLQLHKQMRTLTSPLSP